MKILALLLLASTCFAGDPYWDNVVLCANFPASDGATSFTDSKSKAFTFLGNAQIDTAIIPTGAEGALLLDGSGDYCAIATSTDWNFSTGDWTIEAFVNNANVTAGQQRTIYSHYAFPPPSGFAMLYRTNDGLQFIDALSAPTTRSFVASISTWYHMAICKSSGVVRFYVDGNKIGADLADILDYDLAGVNLQIGRTHTTTLDFNGSLAGLRITKGAARYTDSTYIIPSLPYPTTQGADNSILSPYLKNSNRLDMMPPKLFMFLPMFWATEAKAMSADNRAEGQRHQNLFLQDRVRYTERVRDADIAAGRLTRTPTPTPKPYISPTRTPVPVSPTVTLTRGR